MPVLLREAIGERLRRARTGQQRTLRDVSKAARVSLGYLSEVERGRKEASSELLAAICGALELPLSHLLQDVAYDMGDGRRDGAVPRDFEGVEQPFDREFERELDRVIEGGRLAPATVGAAKAELRIAPRLAHRLAGPVGTAPGVPEAKLAALSKASVYAA